MVALDDLMKAATQELEASLLRSRAAFKHKLTSGESTEAAVRAFLRENYPESVGICHGQVIDVNGDSSAQLDVIMYDKARTPVFYADRENGVRLIPAEGVLAAMEVKHRVTTDDLRKSARDAETLKKLKREAYFAKSPSAPFGSPQNLYGTTWSTAVPPLFLVFAFEGPTLETTTSTLRDAHEGKELHHRVDMACILDRGITVNIAENPRRISVDPRPNTELKGYNALNALLTTHVLMSGVVLQMYIPAINIQRYLPPNFDF